MSFNKRIYGTWEKVKLSNLIHHLSTTSVPEETILTNQLRYCRRIPVHYANDSCSARPWTVSGNCLKQCHSSAKPQLLACRNSTANRRGIGDCKVCNPSATDVQTQVNKVEPLTKKYVNRNKNLVWSTKGNLETGDEESAKCLTQRISKSNETLNLPKNNNANPQETDKLVKPVGGSIEWPVKRSNSIPSITYKVEKKKNVVLSKPASFETNKVKRIQNYNQNMKDLIHAPSSSQNSPLSLSKQQENTQNKSNFDSVEFYKPCQHVDSLNNVNSLPLDIRVTNQEKKIKQYLHPTSTQNVSNNANTKCDKTAVVPHDQDKNNMKVDGNIKMRTTTNENPAVGNNTNSFMLKGVSHKEGSSFSKKESNIIWPPLYAVKTVDNSNQEQKFLLNLKQKIEKVSNNIELKKKSIDPEFSMGRVFNVAHVSNSIFKQPCKAKSFTDFGSKRNASKNDIKVIKNSNTKNKVPPLKILKPKFPMTSPPQMEKALPLRKSPNKSLVSNANSVVSNPKFFAIQDFMEENKSKLKSTIKKFLDEKKKQLTTDLKDEIQEWKRIGSVKKRIDETKTKLRKQIAEKSSDIRKTKKKRGVMKKKILSTSTAIPLAKVLLLKGDPPVLEKTSKAQFIMNDESKPDSLDATNVMQKKYKKTLLKNKYSNHALKKFKDFVREKEMVKVKEKFDQAVIPVMQRNLELQIMQQNKADDNKLKDLITADGMSKPSNHESIIGFSENLNLFTNSLVKQKNVLDIPETPKKQLLKSVSGNSGNNHSDTKSFYTSYPSGYSKKPELIIEKHLDTENHRIGIQNKHIVLSLSKNSLRKGNNLEINPEIISTSSENVVLPEKKTYSDLVNEHCKNSNPKASLVSSINNISQNEVINNTSIHSFDLRSTLGYDPNIIEFHETKPMEQKQINKINSQLELNEESDNSGSLENSQDNTSLEKLLENTKNISKSPLDKDFKFHYVLESCNKTVGRDDFSIEKNSPSQDHLYNEERRINNTIYSSKEKKLYSIKQEIEPTSVINNINVSSVETNIPNVYQINEKLNDSSSKPAQNISESKKMCDPDTETIRYGTQVKDNEVYSKNSDPIINDTIHRCKQFDNHFEREPLNSVDVSSETVSLQHKKENDFVNVDKLQRANKGECPPDKALPKLEESPLYNILLKIFNDWPKIESLLKRNNNSTQIVDSANVQHANKNPDPSPLLTTNVPLKPPFIEYRHTSKSSNEINEDQLYQTMLPKKDTPKKLGVFEFFSDVYNYIKDSKQMYLDSKSNPLLPTHELGSTNFKEAIEERIESSNTKDRIVKKKTIKKETITNEKIVPQTNVLVENNMQIVKEKNDECKGIDQNKIENVLKISEPNLAINQSNIVLSRRTINEIREEETIKTVNGSENSEKKEGGVDTFKSSCNKTWPNFQVSSGLHTMSKKESDGRGIAGYLWDQIFQKSPKKNSLIFGSDNLQPGNYGEISSCDHLNHAIADIASTSNCNVQNISSNVQNRKLGVLQKSSCPEDLTCQSMTFGERDSKKFVTDENTNKLLDRPEATAFKNYSLLEALKNLCLQYERNFIQPNAQNSSKSQKINVSKTSNPKLIQNLELTKCAHNDSHSINSFSLKRKKKKTSFKEEFPVRFNKHKNNNKRKLPEASALVHTNKISCPKKRRTKQKILHLKDMLTSRKKRNSFISEMLNPRDRFLSVLQWEVKLNDKHLHNPEIFWNKSNQECHSTEIMSYIKKRK